MIAKVPAPVPVCAGVVTVPSVVAATGTARIVLAHHSILHIQASASGQSPSLLLIVSESIVLVI